MQKPKQHIFVCGSYRQGGSQGVCHKKDSLLLLQYFEEEIHDRCLDDVKISSTGCLQVCDEGPIVVVYPQNAWYSNVDEDGAEAILDAIESDSIAEEYLLH